MGDLDPTRTPFLGATWEASPRAEEPALPTYLRAVRAHWVVFLAVIASSVATAALVTSVRPTDYVASARVLVAPVPAGDSTFTGVQVVRESTGDPTRSIQTAAALLESGKAAEATSRALGGQVPVAEVAEGITVEPVGETNLVAVRATAASAEQAAELATTYARTSLAQRSEAVRAQIAERIVALEQQRRSLVSASAGSEAADLTAKIVQLRSAQAQGDPSLSLEQEAPGGAPIGASRPLVLVLAAMAGVALGATGAILLELARTRVRDTEEASAMFPLPVLARVPRLSARGRQAVMESWLHLDVAANEAFQRVHRELAQGARGNTAIMITSASSGDGKTTAAVYLAATMAMAGRRVVLLDCDLRNPRAGRVLGIEGRSWNAVETTAHTGDQLVQVPGLSMSLLSFGRGLLAPGATESLIDRLPDILAEVRPLADLVVVDTAPLGEVSDALVLVNEVDHVVVVTRPGHTDRGSFETMRDLLRRMQAPVSGLLVVGDPRAQGRVYPRRAGSVPAKWAPGGWREDKSVEGRRGQRHGRTSVPTAGTDVPGGGTTRAG